MRRAVNEMLDRASPSQGTGFGLWAQAGSLPPVRDPQVKAPPGLEDATRQAIDANFKRVELDQATLLESLNLRRSHRLKLPDAMIWATARTHGWQLVTRNTKDFPPEWAEIRLPYTL